MQRQTEYFKKEALQFIISIYLKRESDEDVKFIGENVGSTSMFAKNICSSISTGLSQETISRNRHVYGKNRKKVTHNFSIRENLTLVLRTYHLVLFGSCLLQIIFGAVSKRDFLIYEALGILAYMALCLLIRMLMVYTNHNRQANQYLELNKNQKYRVLREGNFYEVTETQIVVGDVLELDFKDTVPASGILVSSFEISMNEEHYGNNTQRKLPLEKCIAYLKSLSLLELKILAEKGSLPSPILLRGTEQSLGSSYRMLVLTVEQEVLLLKRKTRCNVGLNSEKLNDWLGRIEERLQKIVTAISVTYFVILILLLSLKEFLEIQLLSGVEFGEDFLRVFLLGWLGFALLDTSLLRLFFQTQIISYTKNLGSLRDLNKYLTAEQIYITEDNIVKYDEVLIHKIGFPDKDYVMDYEEMNSVGCATREKVYQILEGIRIKSSDSQFTSADGNGWCGTESDIGVNNLIDSSHNKLNEIIHLNTVEQKIFSCLYNKYAEGFDGINELGLAFEQINAGTSRRSAEENCSAVSLNKVAPSESAYPLQLTSHMEPIRKRSDSDKEGGFDSSLKGYLSEFCRFKTQNIVEGIVQLAKQECKTYYYQKYTLKRLQRIENAWINGGIVGMSRDRREKVKRNAKNIRLCGDSTPYLIGFSEGAYNNNYSMSVLVAIVGVEIKYENQVMQKLKKLEHMGVRSSILIYSRDEDQFSESEEQAIRDSKGGRLKQLPKLKAKKSSADSLKRSHIRDTFLQQEIFAQDQDQLKRIVSEYKQRGWIKHQSEEISDFASIKAESGVIRCRDCFIRECGCKNRVEELSNIQGFLESCENTRIIHSLEAETDISYLTVGSEQICNSVVPITKYKADTLKILEDIELGYFLTNSLENSFKVWLHAITIVVSCLIPLSITSFGGAVAPCTLAFTCLMIQLFPVVSHFDIPKSEEERVENGSRRNKIVFTKESSISNLMHALVTMGVLIAVYVKPSMVASQSQTDIEQFLLERENLSLSFDCQQEYSLFLSEQIEKIQCLRQNGHTFTLFSKHVLTIFGFLTLNSFIFAAKSLRNFSQMVYIGLYLCGLGVFLLQLYAVPELIRGSSMRLSFLELLIVIALSVLSNLLSSLLAFIFSCQCPVFNNDEFQSVLSFQQNIEEHYSTKLKRYGNLETQMYTLR